MDKLININVEGYHKVINENEQLIKLKEKYNRNSTFFLMLSLLLFFILIILLVVNLNNGVGINVR